MAKAKSGAKKAAPAGKKTKLEKPVSTATKVAAKPATKVVKAGAASKVVKSVETKAKAKAAEPVAVPAKGKAPVAAAPVKAVAKAAPVAPPASPAKAGKAPAKGKDVPAAPKVERVKPRATKLPPLGEPLTKREMEQLLTAGTGRGVMGEGSLKGRLILQGDLPHLVVIGRDKRELVFVLQGPDQEVLPAYTNHKVSVSGLIKKTTNYGGSVDVRKYSAKKPEAEVAAAPDVPAEAKLRYLSPGEIAQITSAGMGSGMKGFASIRGNLEMTGDEYVLVVSNSGTRQMVSFSLEGKNVKTLRKFVGHTLVVTGVVDKASGWGGKVAMENFEPRPAEFRAVSRDDMELVEVEGDGSPGEHVDVRLNHGLIVRLEETPGFTWAIEPTTAKRVGLREANFEPHSNGPATREFFFTPRNPGAFEVEFFLAKAFTPGQVSKTFKFNVTVKA